MTIFQFFLQNVKIIFYESNFFLQIVNIISAISGKARSLIGQRPTDRMRLKRKKMRKMRGQTIRMTKTNKSNPTWTRRIYVVLNLNLMKRWL